jgi:hypothetical protein
VSAASVMSGLSAFSIMSWRRRKTLMASEALTRH